MPPRSVHLEQDVMRFGRTFPQVHDHMDRGWEKMGMFHRSIGHDQVTVDEIRSAWGDQAAEAAMWHIRDDNNPILMIRSSVRYIPEIIGRRLR